MATPRTVRLALLPLAAALLAPAASRASAQTPPTEGCTLQKNIYTCNSAAFARRLAAAHTVALETQPMDRFTAAQLRHLVADLGKSMAPATNPAQPADLTFLLIPIDSTGVTFGPADHPLATLRVYGPNLDTPGHGPLLWAETLNGQGDRPWPAQVHELIQQFQSRFAPRS